MQETELADFFKIRDEVKKHFWTHELLCNQRKHNTKVMSVPGLVFGFALMFFKERIIYFNFGASVGTVG